MLGVLLPAALHTSPSTFGVGVGVSCIADTLTFIISFNEHKDIRTAHHQRLKLKQCCAFVSERRLLVKSTATSDTFCLTLLQRLSHIARLPYDWRNGQIFPILYMNRCNIGEEIFDKNHKIWRFYCTNHKTKKELFQYTRQR